MNGEHTAALPAGRSRSLWSRLKVPAILLLIGVNVLYFGGNALIDLWQTFGPTTHFSGTISARDQIQPQSEGQQELLIVTIDTAHGPLRFDVPQPTFDETQVGQQATGELDARGLLGHDEGLRSLTADRTNVYRANESSRVFQALFILVIVCGVGVLAMKWIVSHQRRPNPRLHL